MGAAIFGVCFGIGLIIIGAGFGIGKIGASAVDGIARQPEAAGNIRGTAIVLAALIEGATFFALVIALMSIGTANECNQQVDARIKERTIMRELDKKEKKEREEEEKAKK
jgi:F-type H+-transporting ATPase subunit c